MGTISGITGGGGLWAEPPKDTQLNDDIQAYLANPSPANYKALQDRLTQLENNPTYSQFRHELQGISNLVQGINETLQIIQQLQNELHTIPPPTPDEQAKIEEELQAANGALQNMQTTLEDAAHTIP